MALGVGVAVATTPGIAFAQPDSGSASSPNGDPAPADTSAGDASADTAAKAESTATESTAAGSESPAESAGTSQTVSGGDGTPVVVVSSSGGAHSADGDAADLGADAEDLPTGVDIPPAGSGDGGVKPAPAPGSTHDSTPVSAGTADSSSHTAPSEVTGAREASAVAQTVAGGTDPTLRTVTQPAPGSDDESLTLNPGVVNPGVVNPAAVADATSGDPLPAAATAQALATVPSTAVAPATTAASIWDLPSAVLSSVTSWASQALSTVVTDLLSTAPSSSQSPLLWMMLGFARREFETVFGAGPTPLAAILTSGNLLVNGDAESGDASGTGYSAVTVPGWQMVGTPTVVKYGQFRDLPSVLTTPVPVLPDILRFFGFAFPSTAPAGGGNQFFGGGPVSSTQLIQSVDLNQNANLRGEIDGGNVQYNLSALLGGMMWDPSEASITIDFLDQNKASLATNQIGPVTYLDHFLSTGLQERETSGTIPVGTYSAVVKVIFNDLNPSLDHYNNAYADNISFSISSNNAAAAALTQPSSSVGSLDHIFVIYMENKGYSDIVGSPNAPFINQLINDYGFGTNFFSLMHPSIPNYTATIGATDNGVDYNCAEGCVDSQNLTNLLDAANLTWAGYAEDGGGYEQPVDGAVPFLPYANIFDNPAIVNSHIFNTTQMASDFGSIATTPNFVWIGANDAHNMEGPALSDIPIGTLQWAFSTLVGFVGQFFGLTAHQYNVAGGDPWVQDTVNTIFDSAAWKDPNQKCAIFLTWDEDTDNLSLGNGNEGNHVPLVVIPNQAAIGNGGAGTMKSGHFETNQHYNLYSLTRTFEDAFGLTNLTNNDFYAHPLNEFWN